MKTTIQKEPSTRNWLIGTFTAAMSLWLLATIYTELADSIIVASIWIIVSMTSFILSIVHLCKYKDGKGMAITSLVLSSILVFLMFIGAMVAVMEMVI